VSLFVRSAQCWCLLPFGTLILSCLAFPPLTSQLTPNPSTPRPVTPGPSEADTVSEEATLRQLTVLIADARTMERRARRLYEERIRVKLPRSEGGAIALSAAEDVEEDTETGQSVLLKSLSSCRATGTDSTLSCAAAFEEALSGVISFIPSLSSQVITILVKRCAEHLKLVRSVASQVRASTRKGPIEPSYFVHNILKELRAYLNGPGRVIEEELRKKWATAVVEDIAGRCVQFDLSLTGLMTQGLTHTSCTDTRPSSRPRKRPKILSAG
jgi:hypothetical protein